MVSFPVSFLVFLKTDSVILHCIWNCSVLDLFWSWIVYCVNKRILSFVLKSRRQQKLWEQMNKTTNNEIFLSRAVVVGLPFWNKEC